MYSSFSQTVDYADGTPATASQIAKDVSAFLAWTSQPEHDERKHIAIKALTICAILWAALFYYKRWTFASLKSQKFQAIKPRNRKWD